MTRKNLIISLVVLTIIVLVGIAGVYFAKKPAGNTSDTNTNTNTDNNTQKLSPNLTYSVDSSYYKITATGDDFKLKEFVFLPTAPTGLSDYSNFWNNLGSWAVSNGQKIRPFGYGANCEHELARARVEPNSPNLVVIPALCNQHPEYNFIPLLTISDAPTEYSRTIAKDTFTLIGNAKDFQLISATFEGTATGKTFKVP